MNLLHLFFGLLVVILVLLSAYARQRSKMLAFTISLSCATLLQVCLLYIRGYPPVMFAMSLLSFGFFIILADLVVEQLLQKRAKR